MPIDKSSKAVLPQQSATTPFLMWRDGGADFCGRWRGLIVVTILSVVTGVGLQQIEFNGSCELHSVAESVATVFALVVGTLSLVHFYANGSVIHLCVGAGFVGTGLLDGSHAFLTSTWYAKFASSAPDSLIPWSWNASRIFLGAFLVLSCRAQDRQDQRPDDSIIEAKFVYVGVLTLAVLCFLFFAFVPLPTGYTVGFIGRPEELISAGLFAIAAVLLVRRGAWRRSPFSYWLLASVLLSIVVQSMVMSRSAKLFDTPFGLAHLMKVVSYVMVLFGVIYNIHILYRTSAQMTLQISQGEAKLRGIIDHAFNFIGLLSTDGVVLDGNRTGLDAAGVSGDEVFGKPFWETPWWTHSSEMQERLKESIRRANAGETDRFEATHPTPDGSLIYVDFTLKPLRDDSGEIIYLMPEGRNITEQKASRDALITAELRLENALDGAEIGVWDWNVVTDDVFVSPQLTAQLGSAETWNSLTDWVDSLHPDDQDVAEKVIADYLSGDIPEYINTFRLRHVDGSYRSILSKGQLLRDDEGEPLRMVGVHIDITERVEQQRLLAEQAEELKASNTELEQFAYVASHDLQEPLRAISGYTQLLAENYADSLDEKGKGYAHRTVEGVKRMQKLIADLLEYSRVSRNGNSFATVNLSDSVRDARILLDAAIQETGAVIEVDDLPVVLADAGQMVRLLQNLIGNALKYRREVTPEIEISAKRNHDGFWTIRVKDNGIGIAPEHAERVFVIFQRLHGNSKFTGTGIGLAVCRRIVERHGGKIHVESNPNAGCTFVFTLPDAPGRDESSSKLS
ncbi:MAG: PAS domain S-box protein [Rhodopirellula sp.]|nr:PAS domain S-box protein [Rhodopirellula sp.]